MAQINDSSTNRSRFVMHYLLNDFRDPSAEFTMGLAKILKDRFPRDVFLQAGIPYPAGFVPGEWPLPPASLAMPSVLAPHSLLIGIGTGGTVACRMQGDPALSGISVFAVFMPSGIDTCPGKGPRVDLRGSRDGTYGPSVLLRHYKIRHPDPIQTYFLPCLAPGPGPVVHAMAYLIGKYMKQEDIYEYIMAANDIPPFL